MSSPSQTPALDLARFEGFLKPGGPRCAICGGQYDAARAPYCCPLHNAAPALLAECRRLREREQVLAEALARILRIHNRPKGWNRIEHARSIEAWEADARAALDAWAAHRADLDTFAQEDR